MKSKLPKVFLSFCLIGMLAGCQNTNSRAQVLGPVIKAAYIDCKTDDSRRTPCITSVIWIADLVQEGILPGNLEVGSYRCTEVRQLSDQIWQIEGNLVSDIGQHDTLVDVKVGAPEVTEKKNKHGGQTTKTIIEPLKIVLDGIITHTL